MGLTEYELGLLRYESDLWLQFTADIYKSTLTDDAYGGSGPSFLSTPTYTGIRCSVEPGAAHEQERALVAILQEVQSYTVTFPALTDIDVRDRVVVTTENEVLHLECKAVQGPDVYETERRTICIDLGSV